MFNKQKVLDRLTNHKPYINGANSMRRSAVFIPLVRKELTLCVDLLFLFL